MQEIECNRRFEFYDEICEDSYDRLIFPSIEREVRNELTDKANEQAIKMFEVNLKPLLMQPPLKGKVILGLDPAYRTGCKIAVIDGTAPHVVDPKNASDLILNLTQDGNTFIGESIVLNGDTRLGIPGTPNGDILAAILLRGGRIGKSTRGAVDNPNNKKIDKNNAYNLITVDTVLEPSGPGCWIGDVILE